MVIDTWHPVTSDFGLIHRKNFVGSLSGAFQALLPLSNARQRRLFVRTKSDWTACFQNGIQGSDPFPAMSVLAKRMKVVSMRVCATLPGATRPAAIWEVYAPESLGGKPPLNYRRSIAVLNDGGRWIFEQSGIPFDFERTGLYRKLRKRDRFPREVLCEYLEHFSIRPFTDDFFNIDANAPAILLQQLRPVVSMPEFTLEEVVEGKPWKKQT